MRCFESVLLKYGVQVYRPWTLENCNQVFARDVGLDVYKRQEKRRETAIPNAMKVKKKPVDAWIPICLAYIAT